MVNRIRLWAVPGILIALTVLPVFFDVDLVPVFLVLLVLAALTEPQGFSNLKARKKLFLPFAVAFGIYIMYALLSPDLNRALKILERQISLVLIPASILMCHWPKKKIALVCKGFVLTLLSVSAVSFIVLLKFSADNTEWVRIMAQTGTSKALYLQFKYPHLLNAHPTYYSYLLLAALFIVNVGFLDSAKPKRRWLALAWLILSVNLVFLAGRIPILVFILSQLYFLTVFFKTEGDKKTSLLRYVLGSLVFVISALVLFNFPLLKKKTETILNDERMAYWPLAIAKIADNGFLLGEGLGQSNEIIKQSVIEHGDSRERYNGYDLHNQYLRNYVEMGILGFISLLWLIIYPLTSKKIKKKELFSITLSFVLLFALAMITESYLIRLKGIIFFAITSTLLLVANNCQGLHKIENSQKKV